MSGTDKSLAVQKNKLIQFIKKIPIFSKLRDVQAAAILSRCSKIILDEKEILCSQGDNSNSMYILLQGELVVKLKDSTVVTKITPVSSIGEMGVFTGEPRSATVEVTDRSSLLCLKKSDIDALIEKDSKFGVSIMQKVIEVLSERICDDNDRIRQFQNFIVNQDSVKQ
jgi:CRP-like cAMP-binding protein